MNTVCKLCNIQLSLLYIIMIIQTSWYNFFINKLRFIYLCLNHKTVTETFLDSIYTHELMDHVGSWIEFINQIQLNRGKWLQAPWRTTDHLVFGRPLQDLGGKDDESSARYNFKISIKGSHREGVYNHRENKLQRRKIQKITRESARGELSILQWDAFTSYDVDSWLTHGLRYELF